MHILLNFDDMCNTSLFEEEGSVTKNFTNELFQALNHFISFPAMSEPF